MSTQDQAVVLIVDDEDAIPIGFVLERDGHQEIYTMNADTHPNTYADPHAYPLCHSDHNANFYSRSYRNRRKLYVHAWFVFGNRARC